MFFFYKVLKSFSNFLEYYISNNDPVRKLSKIWMAIDFNNSMKVFSHKAKENISS